MTPTPPPGRQHPTIDELRWFVRLRWFAALAVLLGTLAGILWWGGSTTGHAVIAGIGLAMLAYNTALWQLQRGPMTRRRMYALGAGQILLDLAALTMMTLWTGGLGSPFLGLYVLHMIIASLLLPSSASYAAVGVAIVLLTVALRLAGQWPEEPAAIRVALGWVLTLVLTVYVAGHVARRLREQRHRLRRQVRLRKAILDTAAEGIITIDHLGSIRAVNPAAERIFGYDRAELIGRNVNVLMPEPHHSEHDAYIANYLRTGDAKIIGIGREALARHRDGSVFPVHLAVSEVKAGRTRIFTGIVRDISDRKRAEAELQTLNDELVRQQQVLVQNEKMAAMGRMAAGLAHEISNPMASMDSVLQLARRREQGIGPETIDVLREQADRVGRIIRQMTDFANPQDRELESTSLNRVVESALDIIRFDRRLRHVPLDRALSSDTGDVRLVPHAIQQVVVNLVMNALDAVADIAEPRVTVATRREDPWYVIEVRDNGHGIDAEHVGQIFEPFFTTKPVGEGTGLGLSISYSIVRRHGGRCEVESEPGRGTRFLVYLPADATTSSGWEAPTAGDS